MLSNTDAGLRLLFGFRWFDALLVGLAALLVALYVLTANGGFPLDDSWIHQVYGRNLAQTGQWAFVPGQPSAASTSPLYTVLLAVGYALNLPYKLWTHMLGAAALAICALVGTRLGARLLPDNRLAVMAGGLALALAWHLIWAAASGMETMLFSMWTVALLALGWRELDGQPGAFRRGIGFGAAAALAALTRPEGIVLAGLIGLALLVSRLRADGRGVLLWGIGAALGFGVFIAPYLALNLSLTGGLLPDTAAAKQAQNAPVVAAVPFHLRLWVMTQPLAAGGQLLLLPGLVYYGVFWGRRLRRDRQALFALLPLVWAVGLIALYAARLPAPFQHGRYVIPALPALILAGVVGTALIVRDGRSSLLGRAVGRSLGLAAALAWVYFAIGIGPGVYARDVRVIDEEMVTAAHWIAANIPPEQTLAVHDIGAVGYFAPRPILDLAGLVSPEIIPFINDEEPLWDWMRRGGAVYLMAFPDQIPGDDPDDPRLCPVFNTGGQMSRELGGPNMVIYALAWDGVCRG